jgi:uncharacterized damage-inducible protein DinB
MNFWTDYELRRIRGEKPSYPQHASESWLPPGAPPPSEANWQKETARFKELLGALVSMANADSQELSREVSAMHSNQEKRTSTVLAILWQMAAHNSYHVGQIALLRRALGAWPPKAGGDSW